MVAEVLGGVSALKAALDITRALKDIDDANRRNAAIVELLEKILSAREQQAALLDTVADLKDKLQEFETWDREKEQYELREIAPGGYAFVVKNTKNVSGEAPKYCANCFHDRKAMTLQRATNGAGHAVLKCFKCGSEVRLHAPTDAPAERRARAVPRDRQCPYCGEYLDLKEERRHPIFGPVGMKERIFECRGCHKTTSKDYNPSED